jgi:wobble nucleotide-excising tRNase
VNEFEAAYRQLVDDVWCYCINETEHLLKSYTTKLTSNEKALNGLRESKQIGFNKIKEIKDDISKKSEKLTSVQPAVDQINNTLKAYGFTSFHIEPYSEIQGEPQNKYRIVRDDGSEATHTLSEGEATFITFLYFMQLTRGAIDKEKVNEKKIIVLDDPISSLDSNILYLVSAMVKDFAENIKNNTSDVEQLFIFTHNVYFHKEASFIDGRTLESKDVNFWIVRKNNGVSKIQSYGVTNPISSTYELLWKELREDQEISLVSMQNIMRRIIENYFKITGQKPGDYFLSKFESQEEKLVCESLLYWINDGSHTIYDDLHIDQYSDICNIFREVFKDIFDRTGHVETVALLSKLDVDQHIKVKLDMDELDITASESKATYEEIKDYVLKKNDMKVSNLYISQIKRKCGLEVGKNYNVSKKENPIVPNCPPEKEEAIREALEHFKMI